ncbi:MAG: ATP-binding protein [Bacteroidota bacterium]
MDVTNRNAALPQPPTGESAQEALGEVEYALFQSEALYQTFLEQSPIGLAHLDAEGVVTFENHQLRAITGEDPEAAWIGQRIAEVGGLDPSLAGLVDQMLADGQPLGGSDLPFRRHDGAERVLRIHGTPIQHPEHGTVGAVLTVSDITAERARDEELALLRRYDEAEPELHHAARSQSSPADFLEEAAGILGATTRSDHAAVLLFDDTRGVYLETARWNRRANDQATPPLRLDAQLLPVVAGSPLAYAHTELGAPRLRHFLAAVGACEAVALPFHAVEAQGGVLLMLRDTEGERWTRTESAALGRLGVLVQTLWAGLCAEARYRRIVASIEDCLFSFWFGPDGERTYSFLSDQVETITGYRAGAVLDGACSWRGTLVHPDDRTAFARHNRTLRAEHESRLVYRVQTAGGSVRWLRESATPRRDHAGRLVVAGVLSDVTEARETEADLIRTKQDAASATRVKSSFLSMMSHEIRTPLGAINGFADLLLEEVAELDDPPPVVAEFATTIREGSRKVLRLINDIFDLATLQSGRVDVEHNPVALHPVVEAAVRQHTPALADRDLDLVLDLDPADPVVLGDAGRLGSVLEQLLSNAAKFTDEGRVRVATESAPDAVHLRVEDTGIGVAPDYVADMFEPFSQGDNRLNRDYDGSGLGLALAKRLIEAMDGTITVESTQGEGTAFEITLPRADG